MSLPPLTGKKYSRYDRVDAATTLDTGRSCYRGRSVRDVGAAGSLLDSHRCIGCDRVSLGTGREYSSCVGLDNLDAWSGKHGLAGCDHDSNPNGRESTNRRANGNDTECGAVWSLLLGLLGDLCFRPV